MLLSFGMRHGIITLQTPCQCHSTCISQITKARTNTKMQSTAVRMR